MPWKECQIVEERLRFIARLLDGEKMAGLCREFGISRKTGYKIYKRYKDCGVDGLTDRSRRPYRQASQLPMQIERIKPGHPEQNGRHERMHLTLKKEATKPAAENFLVQQARFDNFIEYYNQDRPHQALNMQMPAELYKKSPRPYQGLGDLEYPFHDRAALVTNCGRICYQRRKINLSTVFAGQLVGVKQVTDSVWLVSFMQYDLGYFDAETCRLEPIQNPFRSNVLPM